MRIVFYIFFSILSVIATAQRKSTGDSAFSFVFMSDIHIKPAVVPEFKKAVNTINRMNPDFVIAGGDLVYDVMRGNPPHADSLFRLYKTMSSQIKAPVYNCIGNHELMGIYPESDIDSTHPDYKYGMFEKYFGKTYYSFNHKGWHFIVLNSIDVNGRKQYIGIIDEKQLQWLKADISQLAAGTPVAIITHIPFLSTYNQRYSFNKPDAAAEPNGIMIYNRKEVLGLFDNYNLKLVMQGHIHWIEDIFINNKTHFITPGSVAGRPSWQGTRNGERGFMRIDIKGQELSWKYIEYGR